MADLRIGIDVGGTFTDLAALEADGLRVHKLASTPTDPGVAVLQGIGSVRAGRRVDVVHGNTVGLNAVLTGRTARTAFVTNAGFEDLIEIGRQARDRLYALDPTKPQLPVPRELRFGVGARRHADGREAARPDDAELARLLARLRRAKVEAVAIGLLHAYAHPGDERRIAAALRPLGVPITCSAALWPALGEFERFSTAILNAAIVPLVGGYLRRLATAIRPGRLRLLRSSGGIQELGAAQREPARAIFSGPAGGVVATRALCRRLRVPQVAGFDMGGTSTDVSLVGADTLAADRGSIASLPLALPTLEVHTVGCGGGSIATVDRGGALRVGPESAGADPGPACYGKGSEPTITDAHMVLGHLGAQTLLQGGYPVEPGLALAAITRLARRLGISPLRTAQGILEVADVTMQRALLVITAERAIDPAQVPLVAFGGAGGLHAASLARRLGMPCVLVPPHPGAFSAIGLALAAEASERSLPLLRPLAAIGMPRLRRIAQELARDAVAAVAVPGASARIDVLVRYAGQGPGLRLPFRNGLDAAFARLHASRFGFTAESPLEIVEVRAIAAGPERAWPAAGLPRTRAGRPIPVSRRQGLCGGPAWPVFRREALAAGARCDGPAVVEELSGATWIPPGFTCTVENVGLRLRSISGTSARRA